jgi:dipeptidyl aminopeptidase/acylaminoacyl peptidase
LPPREFRPGDFEAAKWAEVEGPVASVDSAVRHAIATGLVDTTRMGILGWSWGSYVTSYLISHYPGRFQAAASSAGQLFNVAEWWMTPYFAQTFTKSIFGGGPYPRSLDRWMQMSPTMSADRVKIPVLQEYSTASPFGFEFHTAVTSQGGVAELVFYPDELHVFEGPRNRRYSMHLNYDWFNFWLLGEEDSVASKQGQYARWRGMRAKLAAAGAMTNAGGATGLRSTQRSDGRE